jgi:crotonobetainyl-CoA:carnitine CoA-transferase CaiB-like acyl-CoA transferase
MSEAVQAFGGPLAGIRVLEFSAILSGPIAGVCLSDFGAEVVKVEPPEGDFTRFVGAVVPGNSKQFMWRNRGKRSLVVDLKRAAGRELIHALLPRFDVLLTNYRPTVPERLGIDYETVKAIHPGIIYADVTGFGATGPKANDPASDIVAQAYGGSLASAALVDEVNAPRWVNLPIADIPTGLAIAMGVIAALYHRERTGEGQRVSASLLRSVMAFESNRVMREPVSDEHVGNHLLKAVRSVRASGGNYSEMLLSRELSPAALEYSVYFAGYLVKDGAVVFGANTKANRDAIRTAIGLTSDQSDHPGFDRADPNNRAFFAAIKDEIRQIMLTRTVAEWMPLFDAAGAPAAPVNFPEELFDDPQGSLHFAPLEHALTGQQWQVRPLVDMEKSPTSVQCAAPVLDADTDAILRESGLSEEEARKLRAARVVGVRE